MAKKIGRFILENIPGIITAAALAVLVRLVCGFNFFVLLASFLAGYFLVGWIVEFFIMYIDRKSVKRFRGDDRVIPDTETGLRYAAAQRVEIVTDLSGLEAKQEENTKDEKTQDKIGQDEETPA